VKKILAAWEQNRRLAHCISMFAAFPVCPFVPQSLSLELATGIPLPVAFSCPNPGRANKKS